MLHLTRIFSSETSKQTRKNRAKNRIIAGSELTKWIEFLFRDPSAQYSMHPAAWRRSARWVAALPASWASRRLLRALTAFARDPSILPPIRLRSAERCASVSSMSRTQRLIDDRETPSSFASSLTDAPCSRRNRRASSRSTVFIIDNSIASQPDEAGGGDRTRATGMETQGSTTELRPRASI